jgi:hypothetical protein
MFGHRPRVALRKAIFILIACVLVVVSSAQHFVVARSLATAEPNHANHMRLADVNGMTDHSHHKGAHGEEGGHLKKQAQGNAQEPQDGPCCELSCVTFAVIETAAIEIASPMGQDHPAAEFDDMAGRAVFDLMRPPRV